MYIKIDCENGFLLKKMVSVNAVNGLLEIVCADGTKYATKFDPDSCRDVEWQGEIEDALQREEKVFPGFGNTPFPDDDEIAAFRDEWFGLEFEEMKNGEETE